MSLRMAQAEILWIDLQPTLHCLNKRVAQLLSQTAHVRRWSFQHDLDESCSIETIHQLLYETLEASLEPVHLIGHGISGTISCLFAEKYPDLVKSLTLLSVDTLSSNHWSSHYLQMRSRLPCARKSILIHLSSMLFPQISPQASHAFPSLLVKCLDSEFIQGSILGHAPLDNLCVSGVPTLVLNGSDDFVVDSNSEIRWSQILKPGDRYHSVHHGRHFFQFDQASKTAQAITDFIAMISDNWLDRDLNINDFTSLTQG